MEECPHCGYREDGRALVTPTCDDLIERAQTKRQEARSGRGATKNPEWLKWHRFIDLAYELDWKAIVRPKAA
jgi:hypothetical protein